MCPAQLPTLISSHLVQPCATIPLAYLTKQPALTIGNLILFSGLPECPKDTKKFERDFADLKSLTEIDSSIQPLLIRTLSD